MPTNTRLFPGSRPAPIRRRPRALAGFLILLVPLALAARAGVAEGRVINLWPEGVPGLHANAAPERDVNNTYSNVNHPALIEYDPPAGTANGTAVIYVPGGAYIHIAVGGPNGGQITHWLNSLGVKVFVLKYRAKEYGYPAPLQDSLRAVRMLRSRAKEFGIHPNRIGMLGGSAGGHLTALTGTLFNAPEGRTGSPLDKVSGRPDFMILVFPVITMEDPYAHVPSRRALLGRHSSAALRHHTSADEQVSADTPPTFLIHSTADTTVPVENSILFFQAMRRAHRPIEMHIYPLGTHGSGLNPKFGPTSHWPKLCAAWMRWNGWLPPTR